MMRFLESLRKEHGSIEQCVKDHNLLDDEGISRLKANMIVDAATNQSAASKLRHTFELPRLVMPNRANVEFV